MNVPPDVLTKGFSITKHPQGTFYHPVLPSIKWQPDMIWFRSIILRDDKVVSVGFPKFFNYGEHEPSNIKLRQAIERGDPIWVREKMDGSLLIRSNHNNEITFRTRGCVRIGIDECLDEINELIDRKPELRDPYFAPDSSLLFEYVSPRNQIVLQYPVADLVYLARIPHDDLHVDYNFGGIPNSWSKPDSMQMKFTSIEHLLSLVSGRTDEGVVVEVDGTLIKLKTESYLKAHRSKFNMKYETIAECCILNDIYSHDQFEHLLNILDIDFECSDVARSFFDTFFETKESFLSLLTELGKTAAELRHLPRKEFALSIAAKPPNHKSILFCLYADDTESIAKHMLKLLGFSIGKSTAGKVLDVEKSLICPALPPKK